MTTQDLHLQLYARVNKQLRVIIHAHCHHLIWPICRRDTVHVQHLFLESVEILRM